MFKIPKFSPTREKDCAFGKILLKVINKPAEKRI